MDEFRVLSNIFKKSFPEYNVSIRRVKMPAGDLGDCEKKGKKFIIRVDKFAQFQEQVLILIHEFSHVLGWDDPNDHGNKFGKSYAKVYSVYLDKYVNGAEKID